MLASYAPIVAAFQSHLSGVIALPLAQAATKPSGVEIIARAFSPNEVMTPYVYVFYVAYIVAFFFTPIMGAVANYYGIIDEPDNLRKMHSKPVAYLGGVAVFLGWIAGLAVCQFLRPHGGEQTSMPHLYVNFSIIVGASVIVMLGLWDDVVGVNPWAKIAGQLFAATILLYYGIGTHCAAPMFQPVNDRLMHMINWRVPDAVITVLSCAIVYFVVVGCCNATNL